MFESLKRPRAAAVAAALAIVAGFTLPVQLRAAETSPLPPLTLATGSPRLPGKFVWADLATDDVPKASAFYGGLFGWTFQDFGGYLISANDDRPLCGLFQRERPKDKPDASPRWFGYISVRHVEKAARAVTEAGGKVVTPPRKFSQRGEQAVFRDPEGALFGVVKSSAGDPPDFLASPGDWIWIQLLSRNATNAAEFYRKIGGYEVVPNASPGRLSDFVLTSGGYARATVRTIAPGQEKVQPTWLPFVRVSSVADSLSKARELGGRVLVSPKPEVLEGRAAVVADPTGAAIGLLEWSADLLKGGQ